MKAICKYILVVILMTMAISCDAFLETTSQDLIVPKTVEHYKELLQTQINGSIKLVMCYYYDSNRRR